MYDSLFAKKPSMVAPWFIYLYLYLKHHSHYIYKYISLKKKVIDLVTHFKCITWKE